MDFGVGWTGSYTIEMSWVCGIQLRPLSHIATATPTSVIGGIDGCGRRLSPLAGEQEAFRLSRIEGYASKSLYGRILVVDGSSRLLLGLNEVLPETDFIHSSLESSVIVPGQHVSTASRTRPEPSWADVGAGVVVMATGWTEIARILVGGQRFDAL
jgi:hypothetical protein